MTTHKTAYYCLEPECKAYHHENTERCIVPGCNGKLAQGTVYICEYCKKIKVGLDCQICDCGIEMEKVEE